MTKKRLKSVLAPMEKGEIISLMLEVYSSSKEAKSLLDYYCDPDETAKLEEFKRIIKEEFYPRRGEYYNAKLRFSVCRKAISDFGKYRPSAEALADLMVHYVEMLCSFANDIGDIWDQYCDVLENNYHAAMRHLERNGLLEAFDARIRKCIGLAMYCGYGVEDYMQQVYEDAYGKPVGDDGSPGGG